MSARRSLIAPTLSVKERRNAMLAGWHDPDKRKLPRAKLADAVALYEAKFGSRPVYCLTSPQDALDLAKPSRKFPVLPVEIRARHYIQRWTYYVGEHEEDGIPT
jgi:hypothetical protein